MKKIIKLIFMSFFLFLFSGNVFSEAFKFNYSQIPFGKSMQEVLKLCDESEVEEDKDSKVEFIKNYSLSLLNGGIYSMWGMGAYLSSKVSKTYVVTNKDWDSIDKIILYFVSDFGKENYTLMMVAKYQKTDSSDRDTYYQAMRNSISKSLNNYSCSEFSERYRSQSGYNVNSLGAKWTSSGNQIYLFVDDLGIMSSSWLKGPLIVYANNSQCSKYLNAVNAYEADKKKKTEESVTTEF